MKKIKPFKVGDKIVDFGKIHRIFKIKKEKTLNGKKENCIFYKPFFKSEVGQSLICSVPESNIDNADLRKPVSKKKINLTLKLLGKKANGESVVNVTAASAYLKENDPEEAARLLRLLWLEKQNQDKKLSSRKKIIYQNTMRQLIEEIAVVLNIGLKKAKMKIVRRLKKAAPVKSEEK